MGYSEGTVGYSGGTVRVHWGYRGGTVRVQCTPLSSPKEEGKCLKRRRMLFPMFSIVFCSIS